MPKPFNSFYWPDFLSELLYPDHGCCLVYSLSNDPYKATIFLLYRTKSGCMFPAQKPGLGNSWCYKVGPTWIKPNLWAASPGIFLEFSHLKVHFTLIGISLSIYNLAVQLLLFKRMGKRERNTMQPWVNNSLTLNLDLCRKRQLSPGRISRHKRKVQHKRRRIQRKKPGKSKMPDARFKSRAFLRLCLNFKTIAPGFSYFNYRWLAISKFRSVYFKSKRWLK